MKTLSQRLNIPMPNYVTDIYKVRRGKYKNVKVWSTVDLGTCTMEDILITDGYYEPITDFEVYRSKEDLDIILHTNTDIIQIASDTGEVIDLKPLEPIELPKRKEERKFTLDDF